MTTLKNAACSECCSLQESSGVVSNTVCAPSAQRSSWSGSAKAIVQVLLIQLDVEALDAMQIAHAIVPVESIQGERGDLAGNRDDGQQRNCRDD